MSKEEMDELVRANSKDISEEELSKVAGGTSCYGILIAISMECFATLATYISANTKDVF